MTPLKDTLEATTPIAESTSAPAAERPKVDAGQLRSDAVSLEVPVKVHGSRVTEVVRGITPHTEPFEEQTSTMIVFPQGGVLRMTTPVTTGQMVVLTNLKSGHDAICRVVKVRACAPTQSYVELEFTNRQQGYWGVHFASDEIEPTRPFVPPPPPVAAEMEIARNEAKPAPQISWASAAALQSPPARVPEPAVFSAPVKPQSAPETSFVEIGSQEEVQPAASATVIKTKPPRSASSSVPVSMADLRGDVHAAPPPVSTLGSGVPGEMTDLSDALEEASEQRPAATFGRLAASTSLTGAHAAPQRAFGARFDSSALGVTEQPVEVHKDSGHNWFLVAAGVAALLVVGVGGAAYLHVLPGGNKSALKPASVSAPAPEAPAVISPVAANAAPVPVSNPVAQVIQPNPSATVSGPPVSVRVENAVADRASQAPTPAKVQPSAPVNQKAPNRVSDISGALNAHPVSAQRSASGDADSAPSVDAGEAAPGGDLQGLATSANVPPPPPVAEAPVHIGGDVKPPKLLSSALPVYPQIARSSGIEGSVVVDASIDPNGNVIATKVISGPPILRQAAVDALRRWKYAPGTLNGTPIALHLTVTINFHK
jgi:TonB family protein